MAILPVRASCSMSCLSPPPPTPLIPGGDHNTGVCFCISLMPQHDSPVQPELETSRRGLKITVMRESCGIVIVDCVFIPHARSHLASSQSESELTFTAGRSSPVKHTYSELFWLTSCQFRASKPVGVLPEISYPSRSLGHGGVSWVWRYFANSELV